MKTSRFFLIDSKPTSFLSIVDRLPDLYYLLTTKQIWEDISHDNRTWLLDDYKIKTKLIFLLALYDDYSEEKEFLHIFPDFLFTEDFFDKYWLIDEVDYYEDTESRVKEVEGIHTLIENFQNEKVKRWLNTVVQPEQSS